MKRILSRWFSLIGMATVSWFILVGATWAGQGAVAAQAVLNGLPWLLVGVAILYWPFAGMAHLIRSDVDPTWDERRAWKRARSRRSRL